MYINIDAYTRHLQHYEPVLRASSPGRICHSVSIVGCRLQRVKTRILTPAQYIMTIINISRKGRRNSNTKYITRLNDMPTNTILI